MNVCPQLFCCHYGNAISCSYCALWEYPDSTQAAQPGHLSSPFLYKRYRNLTLRSTQKLQKHDLLFHEAQFCVRAASARRCNCRSALPVVDLALITSPVALFLPGLRSSTLAQSIQGISPSVLGVSVPAQMATQAPLPVQRPAGPRHWQWHHAPPRSCNVCFTCSEQKEGSERGPQGLQPPAVFLNHFPSLEISYFWKIISPKKGRNCFLQRWLVLLNYPQSYFSI